jgi:hypothetical protein
VNFSALDLISAHSWQRSVFTTYALSLSFFEAVVLDALVRTGGGKTLILADVDGVRAALSEQGARRAGRDYEVEPIAVQNGVFHPKISLFSSPDECHLLVGSGNLTFGGWGGNLEVIEHLHPSFAPDAINDAADYFSYLSFTDQVRHGVGDECATISDELRRAVNGRSGSGSIRLLHNLDGAISEKLSQIVQDLGGASRIVLASPFWDSGFAVSKLCKDVGLDHVFVHSHPGGSVEGRVGANWPTNTTCTVHPVHVATMKDDPRRLHAKMFEILCTRGRVLVSGSANATNAALGDGRNVEACVVRIQREKSVGWSLDPTDPPELTTSAEEDSEQEDSQVGILRAVLTGDRLKGQVLTPKMMGAAVISQVTTEGPQTLGELNLSGDGTFSIAAPGLEVHSWKGGRLIIRIETLDRRIAEGFVSVASYTEIVRRVGALGPKLFALLSGTETPADVAAIMSWYHEDPKRLTNALTLDIDGGGDEKDKPVREGVRVQVDELGYASLPSSTEHLNLDGAPGIGWKRFMNQVFAAFKERRGPLGNTGAGRAGDDDDDDEKKIDTTRTDPAVAKSLDTFERLLKLLLSLQNAERHALHAFDLAQYICERLQPEGTRARYWLEQIVSALVRHPPAEDRTEDVAAAVLVLLDTRSEISDVREARYKLLQLGFQLGGAPPKVDLVQGFRSVLPLVATFEDLWASVRSVRTFEEQAESYVAAFNRRNPTTDYVEFESAAPKEWPIMRAAVTDASAQKSIIILHQRMRSCPRCGISLPKAEAEKLRRICVATAINCCKRVLIYPGAS